MLDTSWAGLPVLIPEGPGAKRDLVEAFAMIDRRVSQVGIISYPSVAQRDAGNAGLSPSDTAFAWITNEKRLTAWTGTGWSTIWAQSAGWSQAGYFQYTSLNNDSAMAMGTAQVSMRFRRDLDTITAHWWCVRGANTNTGGDNGRWSWRLPGIENQAMKAKSFRHTGTGMITRASSGEEYPCIARLISHERVALDFSHTRTRVHGSSLSWDAGDEVMLQITYEVQG